MEQQQKTYESMMKEWILTYKTCSAFEEQIRAGLIAEEEIEEYLQEKARLIVCLGNLFAIKSIEEKGDFELEYIENELFKEVKEEMAKEEAGLSDFDNAYIGDMLKEMEKDFLTFESPDAEEVTEEGLIQVDEEEEE